MNPPEKPVIAIHPVPLPLAPEEQARADLYALAATLLLRAPEPGLLQALGCADALPSAQQEQPLAQAWGRLTTAAATLGQTAIGEEFAALFISPGTPPVNPYGSYYLSGFMMEKPLAALREDLRSLGLARCQGVGEPEDHLGALCEVMRILIAGHAGAARRTVTAQKTFFMTHIAPWYQRCLLDIRRAEGSNFYRIVADFTQAFFEVEFEAMEMDSSGGSEAIAPHGRKPVLRQAPSQAPS